MIRANLKKLTLDSFAEDSLTFYLATLAPAEIPELFLTASFEDLGGYPVTADDVTAYAVHEEDGTWIGYVLHHRNHRAAKQFHAEYLSVRDGDLYAAHVHRQRLQDAVYAIYRDRSSEQQVLNRQLAYQQRLMHAEYDIGRAERLLAHAVRDGFGPGGRYYIDRTEAFQACRSALDALLARLTDDLGSEVVSRLRQKVKANPDKYRYC
jgi:hypothetical protein